MQLIRNITENNAVCVATIGNFDGVHLGHQALLDKLIAVAKQYQLPATVILFEPQPAEYFLQKNAPARLMNWREKWQVLARYPIDQVICLRFNAHLANMSAEEFVKNILVKKLKVKYLLVGDDFRFGKNRGGDFTLLQQLATQYHFQVLQMPTFTLQNERVGSTQVRQALQKGDLQTAAQLLGHAFQLSGHVIYGDGRGRQIGFPTANIDLHRKKLPLTGIYVVKVLGLGAPLWGAANVGNRPTIDARRDLLEVYILDFDRNIYGKYITVEFLHKLREEEKFPSVEAMQQQIKRDVEQARCYRRDGF